MKFLLVTPRSTGAKTALLKSSVVKVQADIGNTGTYIETFDECYRVEDSFECIMKQFEIGREGVG